MAECDDVAVWLDKLGLNEYTEKFLFAGYSSLQQCVLLSKADLSTIGITKPGHVSRLFRDLQRMKANGEIERSPSPPSSLSPLHEPSTDVTCSPLSTQHQDVSTKPWSKPLRRLASFLMHTKPAPSSAIVPQKPLSSELKFDESCFEPTAPPKPFQRRWSLRKTSVVPRKPLPPELKFDENCVEPTAPPKPFQRRWSLRKTISKNKFFRQHSMYTSKEKVTSGMLAKHTHTHTHTTHTHYTNTHNMNMHTYLKG